MRRWSIAIAALAEAGWASLEAPADAPDRRPVKALINAGDTYPAHDWKTTSPALRDVLSAQELANVEVTATPAKDLTDENLAKYDVLVLNYLDYKKPEASPDTTWSEANKAAFLKAIHDDGKGLVVIHHA